MRILTNSQYNPKGLISINEADDNAPQTVVFCIPIELNKAENIRNMDDFENYFSRGISTKIKDQDLTTTIYLDYVSYKKKFNLDKTNIFYYIFPGKNNKNYISVPKFVANIKGRTIDFHLSLLNFEANNLSKLNIDYYYSGKYFNEELSGKRLVVVEPNWSIMYPISRTVLQRS